MFPLIKLSRLIWVLFVFNLLCWTTTSCKTCWILCVGCKHCDCGLGLKPLDRETIPSLVVGPHGFGSIHHVKTMDNYKLDTCTLS